MNVNWVALVEVAAVTFAGTVVLVVLMAVAARLLAGSFEDDGSGKPLAATIERSVGTGILILMGLLVLFGLYLMVPYFH